MNTVVSDRLCVRQDGHPYQPGEIPAVLASDDFAGPWEVLDVPGADPREVVVVDTRTPAGHPLPCAWRGRGVGCVARAHRIADRLNVVEHFWAHATGSPSS